MICTHGTRIAELAADVVVVAGVVDVPLFDEVGAGVIDDEEVVLVDVANANVFNPLLLVEAVVLVVVGVLELPEGLELELLLLVVVVGGDEGVPVNVNPLPIVAGNWQLEDAGAGWAAGVAGWPWWKVEVPYTPIGCEIKD
jgi:hypothetical protein